jgi:hypothetical protein
MAYSRYSWGQVPSTPYEAVPIQAAPDPEHSNPTDTQYVNMDPIWRENPIGAPTLPLSYTAGDGVAAIVAPGGPIDNTPRSHAYGVGVGPGLTLEQAAEIRDEWGNVDQGDLAARQWVPMTDRIGQTTAALLSDEPGHGDSPQTNLLKITGVGGTDDPYARTGKRLQRDWSGWRWDMHRYAVEQRPQSYRGALPPKAQPAVGGGNQYNSPYANQASGFGLIGPADQFVVPQERRVPEPWDQKLTQQGTVYAAEQVTSWGL